MKYLTFFNNTAHVYVIESDDFIKPDCLDLGDYISVLSDEEKVRFNRYINEKAKFTFLTSHYYLRVLLFSIISEYENLIASDCYAVSPLSFAFAQQLPQSPIWGASTIARNYDLQSLIIETTPSGKPYLKDYPNLFFNLSHTDNLILIAIANSPVGVDVEKNERNADKEAIIKHFFSEKEQQTFFSQPEELRQLAFVKGWTRKEAILKATGEGLSKMNDYEVSFEPVTDKPIINIKAEHKFNVKDFTPKEGYAACLAILEK
jgi:phosphopantetheine--protein transferase-like protein